MATLDISPANVSATSGACTTYTVTELAADGTTATSGQFMPTVTLGGGTTATYGDPAGFLGLFPCTNSTVSASGASGSVFTFGVVTTDTAGTPETTTVTVANSTGTITATAKQNLGQPATPTTVTLGFGASTTGLNSETCPTTTTDPKTNDGSTQEVCATVTGSGSQAVASQPVTFTVNTGTVADSATDAAGTSASTTYKATTDTNGVAVAYVRSTKPGPQTIQAGSGTLTSNVLTDTYQQPANSAAKLALTPSDATIGDGGTQQFTATVTDQYGNPVSGVSVSFTATGSGTFAGQSTATGTTGTDGTASSTLTVPKGSAAGTGTVTASAATPAGTPVLSTATSDYTATGGTTPPPVTKGSPTKLTVTSPSPHKIVATAVISPAKAGTKVFFYVIVNGKRSYARRGVTNAHGSTTIAIRKLKSGSTIRLQARTIDPSGPYSTPVSHRVR